MNPTGPSEHSHIALAERYRAHAAAMVTEHIDRAWDEYRWTPLPDHSAAAAWKRLIDFASKLLFGHSNISAHEIAQTTTRLSQWLHQARLDTNDAIAWLMDETVEPDGLLARICEVAAADLTQSLNDVIMFQFYQQHSAKQRIEIVGQLRCAHPFTDQALDKAPDWTLVDALPQLHELCLEEETMNSLQPMTST